MAKNPFDRTIQNAREKALSKDRNIQFAQVDRSLRFFAKALFAGSVGSPTTGFLQNGLQAVESSPQALSVVLKSGLGFQNLPADVPTSIGGVEGLDDLESYKPLPLLADLTVPIATADVTNARIDIIEVRADRLKTDQQSREIYSNTTKVFTPTDVDKTLEFLLDATKLGTVTSPANSTAAISVKQGIPAASPVVPTTTTGYVKIAEVAVAAGATTLANAVITDSRLQLADNLNPGSREVNIPASAMMAQATAAGAPQAQAEPGRWDSISGTDFVIHVPISQHLLVGDRILSLRCYVRDIGSSTISCTLFEQPLPGSGVGTPVSTVTISDGTASFQSVDITGISFNSTTNVIRTGFSYWIQIRESTSNMPTFLSAIGVRVISDRPAS